MADPQISQITQTQTTMTHTTAIGRILKPQQGIPHLHKVIAVKADGTVQTVINKPVSR